MRTTLIRGAVLVLVSAAGLSVAHADQRRAAQAARPATPEVSVAIRAADADGTTALHHAVQVNDRARVEALVRGGANVSAANRYGVTPLSLAATNGDPAVVELLLAA